MSEGRLSQSQKACLDAMDIPLWVRRDRPEAAPVEQAAAAEPDPGPEQATAAEPEPAAVAEPEQAAVTVPGAEPHVAQMPVADWGTLEQQVSGCTLCALHAGRTRTVFGVGNRHADWMVIGEGPGKEEDRQGEPFVGRAGKLLDSMLLAAGQPRSQVYIGNIVKCRPPNNRDPKPEEAGACRSYLMRQIELVNPKIILAVGRIAAHNLLNIDDSVGRMRGRVHSMPGTGIPVIVTYHPAYLLRTPQQKPEAWQDLVMARQVAHGADTGADDRGPP